MLLLPEALSSEESPSLRLAGFTTASSSSEVVLFNSKVPPAVCSQDQYQLSFLSTVVSTLTRWQLSSAVFWIVVSISAGSTKN